VKAVRNCNELKASGIMNTTYQITADQDDIIIRFPRRLVDEVELTRLLDYMEMESIRRRSQMSTDEANALAKSIKQGAWQQVKALFVE
jgi:RNA polymerase-interacting CarD/CdnL/TRCF family regulator